MKKYTKDNFKTFFARNIAEEALPHINWDVLEKYEGTDIRSKLYAAMMQIYKATGAAPMQLPANHSPLTLSNGTTVSINDANHYAQSEAAVRYLRALEIFEDTFSKTTDIGEIIADHLDQEMPPAGELNFPLAYQVYPAEATHVYFQRQFPQQMSNGRTYESVTGFINHALGKEGIGPGPINIGAEGGVRLIAQFWSSMDRYIQDKLLPKPDGTPGQKGPRMH